MEVCRLSCPCCQMAITETGLLLARLARLEKLGLSFVICPLALERSQSTFFLGAGKTSGQCAMVFRLQLRTIKVLQVCQDL